MSDNNINSLNLAGCAAIGSAAIISGSGFIDEIAIELSKSEFKVDGSFEHKGVLKSVVYDVDNSLKWARVSRQWNFKGFQYSATIGAVLGIVGCFVYKYFQKRPA